MWFSGRVRIKEDQLGAGWEKRIELHDSTFEYTAIFSLLLGIGFAVAGWRARLYWLVAMGIVLIIASTLYLVALALGIK
jgi:hypothetical protein